MEILYDEEYRTRLAAKINEAARWPFPQPASEETALRILEALCNITTLLQGAEIP